MLNLFIALLISSFGNEKLKEKNVKISKIEEAFKRIINACKWIWQKVFSSKKTRNKTRQNNNNEANGDDSNDINGIKFPISERS